MYHRNLTSVTNRCSPFYNFNSIKFACFIPQSRKFTSSSVSTLVRSRSSFSVNPHIPLRPSHKAQWPRLVTMETKPSPENRYFGMQAVQVDSLPFRGSILFPKNGCLILYFIIEKGVEFKKCFHLQNKAKILRLIKFR